MTVRKKGKLLVVDDNRNVLVSVKMLLSSVFEEVETLNSPKRMLQTVADSAIDVVLLDMNFVSGVNNGNEGLFWLRELLRRFPQVPVVLFTAYADIQLAVQAMKDGAFDFVEKPWDNRKLTEVLCNAYDYRRSRMPKAAERREEAMYWGESAAMKHLRFMEEKVAATDANVLITGENGTGKDLLAKELHRLSLRSGQKMVCVDMGAITESLFESELFGHVKGAFTDARTDRKGYVEEADGGTLFLDEIGNLPLRQQSKLLNVLQRRCVTRVGSNNPVAVDIRLICATNKNLPKMVADEEFREDLLYRINTIHLELPPLRERKEDIRPLAERFLAYFSEVYGKTVGAFAPDALAAMESYAWPGNIRELRHTVEKAVIIADADIVGKEELQISRGVMSEPATGGTLEEMERSMIQEALRRCDNNLSMVASSLGITRQTLYNKIKRYNIKF